MPQMHTEESPFGSFLTTRVPESLPSYLVNTSLPTEVFTCLF